MNTYGRECHRVSERYPKGVELIDVTELRGTGIGGKLPQIRWARRPLGGWEWGLEYKQKHQAIRGVSHEKNLRKEAPGRGTSRGKGPELGKDTALHG